MGRFNNLKVALSLSLLVVLIAFASCDDMDSLRMLHILYRHGDRAPINFAPTDPYKDKVKEIWPEGAGQLTKEGKRMEYALGAWLRKRYTTYISPSFVPGEVNVISTDVDRTLMSAQCVLASFYYPNNATRFIDILSWIPTPIHTAPSGADKLLNNDAACPRVASAINKMQSLPEVKTFKAKNKDLFDFLTRVTEQKMETPSEVGFLFDTLMIEKNYNLSLPAWAHEKFEQMRDVSAFSFAMNTMTHELKRLRGGPMVGQIIENMHKKAHGKLPDQKMLMWSAHDITVSALLDTMGVYERSKPPPYAATVLVELHVREGKYFVKAFYQNDSSMANEPQRLTIPGCTHECPLDDWSRLLKSVVPKDWDRECYRPNPVRDHYYIMSLTGLSTIFGAILLCLGYRHLKRTRCFGRLNKGYEPLSKVIVVTPDYGAVDQKENSIRWSHQPRSLL